MPAIADDVYFSILKTNSASEKTYNNYVARLRKLAELAEKPIHDVITNPNESYNIIKEHYPNVNTRKNMLTPILSIYRKTESLQKDFDKEWKTWQRFHENMDRIQEVKAKKNKMNDKQKNNYVSTEDVHLKLLELGKTDPHHTLHSSLQYLLLCLLNDIKPKRSDLGNVKIYRGKDPNKNNENYIVLKCNEDKTAQNMTDTSYLVLNVYSKTKSVYGRIEEDLSFDTARAIVMSLRRHPRDYLFVDKFKKPYTKNDSYGKFVVNTFNALFGKKTGTSLWRHIYIKEKVDASAAEEELDEIARLMLHSSRLQQRYRFAKENTAKDKKKRCICVSSADE